MEKVNLTINEIARLAQVSKGTVSKVLNNYRGINIKTRERVLAIVKEMGYEPNSSAQALALRRTGSIGLVIPHSAEHSLKGDYWSSMVTAIAKESVERGYNLLLLLPKEEGKIEELFKSLVRKKSLDGLIIGADMLEKRYLATLLFAEIPFVMIGRHPDFKHYCVDIDNIAAAQNITEYMIGRGYRKVAILTGPRELSVNTERAMGYAQAMRQAGLNYERHIYVDFDDTKLMEASLNAAFERDRPDAILIGAGGNFMFDAISTLEKMGYTSPKFGLATFDDYRYLDFVQPRVTAVRQPVYQFGSEAVILLSRLLRGEQPLPEENQTVILPTTIVPRASCGE